MNIKVSAVICTKNRYDMLSIPLHAIATQTMKPDEVIIVDNTEAKDRKDIREIPSLRAMLMMCNAYGIDWRVQFNDMPGQHISHQISQNIAKHDWIWRIDDDECPAPTCLENLCNVVTDKVGAVGGCVWIPMPADRPPNAANKIADLSLPNLQWYRPLEKENTHWIPQEVDHLHSTFIYRRNKVNYEMGLSPAAHREETVFTYELKRAGFKILFNPAAVTWHFRAETGGIRSYNQIAFWNSDDALFQRKLKEWGVTTESSKLLVLDAGLGDHVIVKSLMPLLKQKYPKLTIACCWPDILKDEGVELISIAEAKTRLGPTASDLENVYLWCITHDWQKPLREAYIEMWGL